MAGPARLKVNEQLLLTPVDAKSPLPPFVKGGVQSSPLEKGDLGGFAFSRQKPKIKRQALRPALSQKLKTEKVSVVGRVLRTMRVGRASVPAN
jgi:hypothetical protein